MFGKLDKRYRERQEREFEDEIINEAANEAAGMVDDETLTEVDELTAVDPDSVNDRALSKARAAIDDISDEDIFDGDLDDLLEDIDDEDDDE